MAPHSEPVLLPIKLISVSFRDYRKRIILTMRAANDLIDCCTIDRVRLTDRSLRLRLANIVTDHDVQPLRMSTTVVTDIKHSLTQAKWFAVNQSI